MVPEHHDVARPDGLCLRDDSLLHLEERTLASGKLPWVELTTLEVCKEEFAGRRRVAVGTTVDHLHAEES